jgi:hypothetical protein
LAVSTHVGCAQPDDRIGETALVQMTSSKAPRTARLARARYSPDPSVSRAKRPLGFVFAFSTTFHPPMDRISSWTGTRSEHWVRLPAGLTRPRARSPPPGA